MFWVSYFLSPTSWHLFCTLRPANEICKPKSLAIWQSLILTLDIASSWATCVTILKLDGHSFCFFIYYCTYLSALSDDLNRPLMYPGRSVTGPLAYKTRRLLNEIGCRSFSACLKKGSVTSLSREAPLCNIGLGPSLDLYSLLGPGI